MTPALYFAIRLIQEGKARIVERRMLDTLMAKGFVGLDATGKAFVTAAGAKIADAYGARAVTGEGRTAARRAVDEIRAERSDPIDDVVAHDGELLHMRHKCATELPGGVRCNGELAWHMNKMPRPHPETGCPGFTKERRAVA